MLVIGHAGHHDISHLNGTSFAQNDQSSSTLGLLCERLKLPKLSDQTLSEKVKVCNRTNSNCILAGGKLNDIKESRVVQIKKEEYDTTIIFADLKSIDGSEPKLEKE